MRLYQSVRRLLNALVGAAVALVLGLPLVASSALAAEGPRRVFLLEGLSGTEVWVQSSVEAFTQRLKQRSSEDIEVYSDFLDLGRFRGTANEDQLARYLAEKFALVRPEVVVPINRAAVDFVIRHRDDFARGIPIVYCCSASIPGDEQNIPRDIPGVVIDFDWGGTMALARRLQPDAKTLVIIEGASDTDRRRTEDAQRELRPFFRDYDTRFLNGLPYDQLLREVSRVPRNSIVLLRRVFEDGSGRSRGPELGHDLSIASAAPVYSASPTYIGSGVVGGRTDSFVAQAIKVADLVQEILSGKDPSALPHQTKLPARYWVDARALRRWGFAESSLPSGTVVEFRQPTMLEQYRNVIILVLLAFGVQAGIIALLLFQKHKRRAAEKLLRASEDRMAFAASSTNTGLWRLDAASGRLWVTDHCREMFGLAADEQPTPERLREAVHMDDRQAFDDCLQSPAEEQRPAAGEFRIALPGHGLRWYAFRRHTISGGDGRPFEASGIFTDVTELKKAETQADLQREELAHMMRVAALGELSGGIAHELSQPLAAILANAQAAQVMLANKKHEEIAEILEDIVQEDTRAGQVVHRLRRLLKKGEHESAAIDLNEKVTSTLELLHSELVNRKIKVETDLKPDLPLTCGDRVQLQQVLLNLMMNAMEAMSSTPASKRLLSIATRTADEGYVEVSIRDHGSGMSSDALKRIFEPFFTTKERGLGLGLPICSTIVAAHRGQLALSNASGGGASAVVSLPIAAQLAVA
jgi:C4-dicarboxylate-specific signal transduction histidine kinase